MKVAMYVRVSTRGQTVKNQLKDLKQVASNAGWDVVEIYKDEGISGAKGRDGRPELDRMLKDATRRRFRKLMVWDISRLGRSLGDLIETTRELEEAKVSLFFHRDAVDTATASGKLFFHIVGAIGEFERERIRERINSGLDRARAQGKVLGRKKGSYTIDRAKVRKLRDAGGSIRGVAKELGISPSTVQAALKAG